MYKSRSKIIKMESRYVFTLVAFVAYMFALGGRDSLRLAVISMRNEYLTCISETFYQNQNLSTNHFINNCGSIEWSESDVAITLSGYSIGAMLTGAISGLVADSFSSKNIMLITSFIGSLCTFFLPLTSHNLYLLVGGQILSGMAGGFVCPVLTSLLTRWEPVSERGKLSTIVYSGSSASAILTSLLNGFINTYDWRLPFYGFGLLQFLWLVLWYFLVHDFPYKNPRISDAEKMMLSKETHVPERRVKLKDIPFFKLLSNKGIWAVLVANMGYQWGKTHILYLLPQYVDHIGVSIEKNGLMNALPHAGMLLTGIMASSLFNFINRNYLSLTSSRKLVTSISFIGFGSLNMLLPLVGQLHLMDTDHHSILVTTLSTLGYSLLGFYIVGGWTCAMDVAPDFAGTIMGISSCLNFLVSALVPYTVSAFTSILSPNQVWPSVFMLTSTICVICTMVFNIFGTADLQISVSCSSPESPNLSEKDGQVRNE